MYRKIPSVLAALILLAAYLIFLNRYTQSDGNERPSIEFDEPQLVLSVSDDWGRLLEGVHCYDAEDGDLSDRVLVDSISAFDEQGCRTVKYVVFDSENQSAVAERKLSYTDYTPPVIKLTGSLIVTNISDASISGLLSAQSCVDGDLTRSVDVKIGNLEQNVLPVEASVTDSTGTVTELDFTCEYDNTVYQADIRLQEYLLYVPAGQMIDLQGNIADILIGKQSNMQLANQVMVQSAVDFNTPGTYEVYYYLNSDTGITGRCKAIVVVQ